MVAMMKFVAVLVVANTAGGRFYFPPAAGPLGGDVVTYEGSVDKIRPGKPGYLETFVDPYEGDASLRR